MLRNNVWRGKLALLFGAISPMSLCSGNIACVVYSSFTFFVSVFRQGASEQHMPKPQTSKQKCNGLLCKKKNDIKKQNKKKTTNGIWLCSRWCFLFFETNNSIWVEQRASPLLNFFLLPFLLPNCANHTFWEQMGCTDKTAIDGLKKKKYWVEGIIGMFIIAQSHRKITG